MARRTEIYCDRCGATDAKRHITQVGYVGGLDLCAGCMKAYERFMKGDDYVGSKRTVHVPGPCPHHIPCAGPCGSEIAIPTGSL